ncbi:ABC transporter ATP-binding protein [Aquibacillus koreensis]|uniref:ABC transporter ATP-binding protein n=1 Tax=Aquibacillus koreensis TaxID=279446 RepID=A0A9X3WI79_9BACI|nr:ABC transporter ATP-binding protein [Aquibacillus koreensis]MCT2536484.1 ABC transporter ATP-binding protein [Aquibacillus koreensis]MDC3419428.1 ABC transporter ATP-binding protein [Aquibacillus koreensis]
MPDNKLVQVSNLGKSFDVNGTEEKVLHDISLHVDRNEVVSVLGESGCGKSTLLNIIGGFEKPTTGEVTIDGKTVQKPSKNCMMLFQNYGLLPWRTVFKNVELGLEGQKMSASERNERVFKYLELVGLENKGQQFPHEMSGGMQQRVAIARALVTEPDMILMDEPFAALDTFNRYYLQDELLKIQERSHTTIVLVTHDIDEAIYLSDRIFMMSKNPGEIHREIKIDLSKPRDRSHSNFQYYRKQILEEFKFSGEKSNIGFHI